MERNGYGMWGSEWRDEVMSEKKALTITKGLDVREWGQTAL